MKKIFYVLALASVGLFLGVDNLYSDDGVGSSCDVADDCSDGLGCSRGVCTDLDTLLDQAITDLMREDLIKYRVLDDFIHLVFTVNDPTADGYSDHVNDLNSPYIANVNDSLFDFLEAIDDIDLASFDHDLSPRPHFIIGLLGFHEYNDLVHAVNAYRRHESSFNESQVKVAQFKLAHKITRFYDRFAE